MERRQIRSQAGQRLPEEAMYVCVRPLYSLFAGTPLLRMSSSPTITFSSIASMYPSSTTAVPTHKVQLPRGHPVVGEEQEPITPISQPPGELLTLRVPPAPTYCLRTGYTRSPPWTADPAHKAPAATSSSATASSHSTAGWTSHFFWPGNKCENPYPPATPQCPAGQQRSLKCCLPRAHATEFAPNFAPEE